MSARRLILASTSPRRFDILSQLGVPFEVLDPKLVEPEPAPGTDGPAFARDLAERKARAAARALGDDPARPFAPAVTTDLLAADTVVQCGRELPGKPVDRADAIRILMVLSGQPHLVATGWCLRTLHPDGAREEASGVAVTRIRFRPLTRAEIEAYVDTGEPFGKAGAYAVQEHGDRFVAGIDGDFSTVVGLPVPVVAGLLAARGYAVQRPALSSIRAGGPTAERETPP